MRSAIFLLGLVMCAGCASNAPKSAGTHETKPADADATATAAAAGHGHVLHNIHRIGNGIISGSAPESDAAFDELASMGVKTVLTVDGGTPMIDAAHARGMRYVHIPAGYNGISKDQQLLIAKAVRDLPGPIYIHCHHGKHRGPAAAAGAAVQLGLMTPEQGVEFLRDAGTSPSYPGLFACVQDARPLEAHALDQVTAAAELPEVACVKGIVATMVEVDAVYDRLKDIQSAGWTVPKSHPDLVPAAEAGRLADLYRHLHDDAGTRAKPEDFAQRLSAAAAAAQKLEDQIVNHESPAQLTATFTLVGASCKDCHVKYRDK